MSATGPLVRNFAVEVRNSRASDGNPGLTVCAYSAARGFTEQFVSQGQPEIFVAVQEWAREPSTATLRLKPADALTLWSLGLIVAPPERAAPFAPERFTDSGDNFADQGFAIIRDGVTAEMQAAIVTHYQSAIATGAAEPLRGVQSRNTLHNDPAGRIMLASLHPAVEAMVGRPIKPSYSYASLYAGGAELPRHRDRRQCKYTLSLLLDHRPVPEDGISPWLLQVTPRDAAQPFNCSLPLRGGVLFCGSELFHGRPSLPLNQTCWTLLLHYVDADFDGDLD